MSKNPLDLPTIRRILLYVIIINAESTPSCFLVSGGMRATEQLTIRLKDIESFPPSPKKHKKRMPNTQ
jgi:hypothetical protein